MHRKKADVAVLILVFLILALVLGALFIFYTNLNKVGGEITDARILDSIYIKESQIDFYANEITGNAAKSMKTGEGENNFSGYFKNELARYKVNDKYVLDELVGLENSVIEIKDNKIIVTISLIIGGGNDKIKASYIYIKKIEKTIIY